MRRFKLLLTFLVFCCVVSVAQERRNSQRPPFVVVADGDSLPHYTDEQLWRDAIAITFQVNRTNVNPADEGYRKVVSALCHIPDGYTFCRLLVIRGSASPEGPAGNNVRLAHHRARAIVDSLRRYVTLPDSVIEERYVAEDYQGLARMLTTSDCPYKKEVLTLVNTISDQRLLKAKLQRIDGGKAWRELLRDYFPQLRATRVVIVVSHSPKEDKTVVADTTASVVAVPATTVVEPAHDATSTVLPPATRQPRRELLAVKTNLLMYAAWVPQYGFCPMPNIELEYFPLKGHFTIGGTFDMPWWQSSAYNAKTRTSTGRSHKFFQVRQYQLYARWYAKDGGTAKGFRGFFVQPYVNLAIFGIGFKADKGWMGEGLGGGVGAGYRLPLGSLGDGTVDHPRTRASHWHLEFAAQLGIFAYKYDPYQYGCPKDGIVDGHYYYRYKGNPSLFHKRNHHRAWFGPTRVGITLSYDLLYRSRNSMVNHGKTAQGLVGNEKGGSR